MKFYSERQKSFVARYKKRYDRKKDLRKACDNNLAGFYVADKQFFL